MNTIKKRLPRYLREQIDTQIPNWRDPSTPVNLGWFVKGSTTAPEHVTDDPENHRMDEFLFMNGDENWRVDVIDGVVYTQSAS